MPAKTAAKSKTGLAETVDGIKITPIPATAGETITITYDGTLAQNKAHIVYAHIGYGHNDSWSDIQDVPMTKKPRGWTCAVTPQGDKMNFCFHDEANNWDNNYGRNWSIHIHHGDL